jgi:hypothetical protein
MDQTAEPGVACDDAALTRRRGNVRESHRGGFEAFWGVFVV